MSTVFVAGHRGLVGSAICRRLERDGINPLVADRRTLDLKDQATVRTWFEEHDVDEVYFAAAKVGGILANSECPADFINDNIVMQSNVIDSAWRGGVRKFLFLGSSCIYPKYADQPISENSLLMGPLEPTNQWYAIAKIAGIKTCQAYRRQHSFDAICLMPTNIYGSGDNFDLRSAHVLPALLRKCHEAKVNNSPVLEVWGSGEPRREFLHADDLADACVFMMSNYSDEEIVNVGCGEDVSIRDLAELIKVVVGYQGELVFDRSKPDGTPRKLLNVSKIHRIGWSPKISLEKGLRSTYDWYLKNFKV